MTGGERRHVSLGQGTSVPYPTPTSDGATAVAKGNRSRDTKPETRLRAALHARGLRFRKDYVIVCDSLRTRADIVFTRQLVAVFVDGCFWHGCPDHGSTPRRNVEYWIPKLEANRQRDRRIDIALSEAGWHVQRTWEHEDPADAADRIEVIVRSRSV